jgi:hypothetical protein
MQADKAGAMAIGNIMKAESIKEMQRQLKSLKGNINAGITTVQFQQMEITALSIVKPVLHGELWRIQWKFKQHYNRGIGCTLDRLRVLPQHHLFSQTMLIGWHP